MCSGKKEQGAPVCPLLWCQKFDGGHFEWHWRVPPEWGATSSERKEEGKKRGNRNKEISMLRKRRRRLGANPWCTWKSSSVMQTICQIMHLRGIHKSVGSACAYAWVCFTTRHCNHAYRAYVFPPWLTVPGMCVLAVLWPFGPVVVVLLIFFFLRSSSRCSFCLFCTSISSEIKLFFTCFCYKTPFWICKF